MKFRSMGVLATAALLFTLTGCASSGDTPGASDGGASDGGPDVSLEFQTGLAVDQALMTTLTDLTKKFEAENDGITIELVPRTESYEADIKVRLAAGDPPDLWATHGWSLLRYSEFLVPLQDEPWAKNFNPALAPAMKNEAGEFFAYPVDTDVAGIVYNADVLESVGVKPTDIKTWDDFVRVATAIKDKGVVPISTSGKDNWLAGNLADWMLSGAYTEAQLKQLADGEFVTDGYKTVLDEIAAWRDAGLFNPDYASATTDDISQALAQGKTAFVFVQNNITTSTQQFNPDVKLGYLPVPSFVDSTGYLIGGEGQAYGISKDATDVDAAKKYIAYLAQPENTSALATAAGTIPGLTNATSDLGILQDSYDQFVSSGEYPLVPYFDRVYLPNGIWDTVVTTADSVITGQGSTEQALKQLQADFKNLYGQG